MTSATGDQEFVRVVCDFSFTPKDAKTPISIKVGEEYWLIDGKDAEEWLVQESELKSPFYIPTRCIEILKKDQTNDVGIQESNTLNKVKNPVPKPRKSKTSSSDETTQGVLTASDDKAKQQLTRTSSSGKAVPQTTKSMYENVEITGQSVAISKADGDSKTTQKTSSGHEEKPKMSKMSSEDEAIRQLDAVLEAGDVQQTEKLTEKQTDVKTDKEAVKQTDSKTGKKPEEKEANSNVFESTSVAKTTVTPKQTEVSSSSSTHPSASEIQDDEINYVNLEDYRQMVDDRSAATTVPTDNRAESETSDYRSGDSKGGSRESLELKSCDTDSTGTKEDLEKQDPATQAESVKRLELPPKPAPGGKAETVSKRTSDYENIEHLHRSNQRPQSKSLDVNDGNSESLLQVTLPPGWIEEEEEKGEKTFVNTANGEKWKIACESTGRKYFYNTLTSQAVWSLAEASKCNEDTHAAEAKVDPPAADFLAEFPPLQPLPLKMVQKQGPLSKAKVYDQGKKAKKPSWSQSYVILIENMLYFYKDLKVTSGSKVKSISSLGKSELILDLENAMVSSSPDEKKKEILVLSLSSGVVYLLHDENEEVLQHWKQSLENNIEAIKTLPVTDCKDIENFPVRPDAVFGSSLTIICEREKTNIPRFVHECLVAVEKRGLDVDGIYRISGNMSLVQKLRQMVDQNEFYDLLSPSWDVHTITGALKLFFRELAEPVFTFALFDEFLSAYRIPDHTQKIQAYREVIGKLPSFHAETMKNLFKHLVEVIKHGISNRMQPQALAIVFGPTLLWPESKNKDVTLAASMVYQGQVVEFMIIEFRSIFS